MEVNFHSLSINIYLPLGSFLSFKWRFFYSSKKFFNEFFPNLKIFKKNATKKQVRLEMKNSAISIGIINLMAFGVYEAYHLGALQINDKVPSFWPIIFTLQFFIMHTLHDAYFLLDPSLDARNKMDETVAFYSSSVSCTNAFFCIQFLLARGKYSRTIFCLDFVSFIPMHWAVFSYFYAFLFWINVFGHMNFDFWPQGHFYR